MRQTEVELRKLYPLPEISVVVNLVFSYRHNLPIFMTLNKVIPAQLP